MRGPGSTGYYKLCLDSLGPPRIACTRLEAAGRKIAQQFFVQYEIDKAVLETQTNISAASSAMQTGSRLPMNPKQLRKLQDLIPYSGPDLQTLVHSAESYPLQNASVEDIKRLLKPSKHITRAIAETANRSHLWASDWIKVIGKLLSMQKIAQSQTITESLISSGEKLPLGILAAALNIARLKGNRETFVYYASCCPIQRIPIPYPATQVQLVISQVRYHRAPQFLGLQNSTYLQFFSENWLQDPSVYELFKALAKGYVKYHDPEMLDLVMWWASYTNRLSGDIAYINLAAARQWNDPQRAWWTWQQVEAGGLETLELVEIANSFECLRDQVRAFVVTEPTLIEATPS